MSHPPSVAARGSRVVVIVICRYGAVGWPTDPRRSPTTDAEFRAGRPVVLERRTRRRSARQPGPGPDPRSACTAAHTAEESSRLDRWDQRLVRTAQKAKGQDATVNSFVMATGCPGPRASTRPGRTFGGAWRGAPADRLPPDFVVPAKDGFFACVIAPGRRSQRPAVGDPYGQPCRHAQRSRRRLRSASTASETRRSEAAGGRKRQARFQSSPGRRRSPVPSSPAVVRRAQFRRMVGSPTTSEFRRPLHGYTGQPRPYNGPGIEKVVHRRMPANWFDSFVGVAAGQKRSDLRVSEVGPDSANPVGGQRSDIRVPTHRRPHHGPAPSREIGDPGGLAAADPGSQDWRA